jgi:hypothetical protein
MDYSSTRKEGKRDSVACSPVPRSRQTELQPVVDSRRASYISGVINSFLTKPS